MREEKPTRLAVAIRLYVASRNIDQKTIAKSVGCGQSTITRFLSGEAIPESLTMLKIATWLMEADDAR